MKNLKLLRNPIVKPGTLYKTTRDIILCLNQPLLEIEVSQNQLFTRKLRVRWNTETAEDLRVYCDVSVWKREIIVPQQIGDVCYVPQGTMVMYVETGKTGNYKLVCGDFIGWTSETTLLLEEIEDVD